MIAQKPLVTCDYGWGRSLKLYEDFLDVDGTLYALNELMQMHALYRRVMNISSLRLELQFGVKHLILRGITANEAAEQVVAHLKNYCPGATITTSPSVKGRVKLVSNKRVATSVSETQTEPEQRVEANRETVTETPRWLLDLAHDMQRMQTRKAQRANSLPGNTDLEDAEREQLALHLQADTLPSLTIPIPLRLAPGEQARYSIEATLCAELLSDGSSESPSYSYPAKDQGTLILTNRRLVYMGRRGQRVLGYARILRVSRLRGAVALLTDMSERAGVQKNEQIGVHMGIMGTEGVMNYAPTRAEQRTQREIFQVSRPLECALYLDHLLRQFYVQVATQHLAPQSPVEQHDTLKQPVVQPIHTHKEQQNQQTQQREQIQHDESQQWAFSTRATEKVVAIHTPNVARTDNTDINGATEGIDVHSIQRSLASIADLTEIETCPLTAVRRVRV